MIVDTSEPQQPQLLRTVRDSHTGLSSVSVNPDGSVVAATNSDGRVLVWDAADDEFPLLYQLRPGLGSLGDVDLYDGQITVGGNNGAVFTWGVDVASARTQVCEGLGDLLSPDEWRAIVPGIESMRICE
ncbi:WD40 repeat domain-containing protein [Tessaracoccus massiliensis]|uniref:WD40 repeat domain-containing protein n=1 Tax=Tessaracoccus massiliensis TaxID=1522311 RepID=UPI00058F834F